MTQSVTTASTLKGSRPLLRMFIALSCILPEEHTGPLLQQPFAVLIRDARPQCDYEFIKDIFAQGQINKLHL